MSFDLIRRRLADVIAITLTPFDESGGIDDEAFARTIRRMVEAGVRTLTVNGNTSEFYTLSPAEARRGVELTTRAAERDTLVIAGVGLDVDTAVRAARDAGELGVQAVMVHQPVHPYISNEGWVHYNRQIAEQIPDLAVIPYVRNEAIGAQDFLALIEACDNVVGVKYAVPDVVRFATICREIGDRVVWIDGLAELAAPGYFAVGAAGFTSGLVNVFPRLSLDLFAALRDQRRAEALEIWDLVREFEEMRLVRNGADNVSVIKEALHQLGVCGPEVRAPSSRLSSEDRVRVEKILHYWGVAE
ncbi:dihydrodipicolinate synthase family protein [Nocardia carnea]|uniref:dihydrodipicolinate synthase family protein n=1 Tax=Nocardia carnea TaxID=37328 RepID=UPI0024580EC3|nr:dihydrodipicolinate synthase family protein [Nocardia carnea]